MASEVTPSADRSVAVDPTQLRLDPEAQTFWQRGLQKCKQQPFVPLGTLLTCIALGGAFRELRRGNSKQLNRYLRFRVVAQGATVAAMVAGSYIYTTNVKPQIEQEAAEERERILQKIAAAGQPKPQEDNLAIPLPQEEIPVATARPKRVQYVVKKDGSQDSLNEFWKKTEEQPASEASGNPPSRSDDSIWSSLPWSKSSSEGKGKN